MCGLRKRTLELGKADSSSGPTIDYLGGSKSLLCFLDLRFLKGNTGGRPF